MSALNTMLRGYIELARLSNAPTVITNVLVGAAIGLASANPARELPVFRVSAIAVALWLLYAAGMTLNDVVDLSIDRAERPHRPLPSGRVRVRAAVTGVLMCMGIALVIAGAIGLMTALLTLLLVIAIITYDLIHKKAPASVVLMGVCRGLVYLITASVVNWPFDWTIAGSLAGAITLYIIALTIVARIETREHAGNRAISALALPAIALAPALIVQPSTPWYAVSAGVVCFAWLLWSARHLYRSPARIGLAVQGWLAGICLVDAYFLTLLDQPTLAAIAGAGFLLTIIGHRFIPGT